MLQRGVPPLHPATTWMTLIQQRRRSTLALACALRSGEVWVHACMGDVLLLIHAVHGPS